MITVNSAGILATSVTRLLKYTEYEFQVLAFTTAGDGPKSSVQTERTKEDGKELKNVDNEVLSGMSFGVYD